MMGDCLIKQRGPAPKSTVHEIVMYLGQRWYFVMLAAVMSAVE